MSGEGKNVTDLPFLSNQSTVGKWDRATIDTFIRAIPFPYQVRWDPEDNIIAIWDPVKHNHVASYLHNFTDEENGGVRYEALKAALNNLECA